jgi:hypothetical protein
MLVRSSSPDAESSVLESAEQAAVLATSPTRSAVRPVRRRGDVMVTAPVARCVPTAYIEWLGVTIEQTGF